MTLPVVPDLPSSPSPTDDVPTFNSKMFAWIVSIADWTTAVNALSTALNSLSDTILGWATSASGSASAASASASSATAAANAAAASAGAVLWVSGTTYTIGFRAWSPTNQRVYVRKTAGAGTTDPSADPTNWRFLAGQRPVYRQVTGTSTTALPGEWLGLANAALTTVTAPASPSVDDEFWVSPENGRSDNKVARNSQLIMGLAEDLDIGSRDETVRLVFVGGSIGWRLLDV